MEACSLTELRRRPQACIARAVESRNPLLITRRGKPLAVLMSIETHERMHREREALKALALGSAGESPAQTSGGEISPLIREFRGCLQAAKPDEEGHRRYLEEEYR